MDGFLNRCERGCIRAATAFDNTNFPAVLWAWLKTKDVQFTQWPDVAFSTIGEGIYLWPFIKSFSTKNLRSTDKQISVVFVYVPDFCMARQEVKPTLKFGFQVYRQFVCEESFQDFCVGPILIANYILISPQFKK